MSRRLDLSSRWDSICPTRQGMHTRCQSFDVTMGRSFHNDGSDLTWLYSVSLSMCSKRLRSTGSREYVTGDYASP